MFSALLRNLVFLPLFNLLMFIYAVLPSHNFGQAVILFTLAVRIFLWPLLKKQLHQQRAIKELQPEIKKIKAKAKGDRQKESMMLMELYKEREINPLSSIGTLLIQLPILITLFFMLRDVLGKEGQELSEYFANNSYAFIAELGSVKEVITNPELFNPTLFGIDLKQPSLILALLAGAGQFAQSRGLQPKDKDAKTLRDILNDAKEGKVTPQAEQTAAMARSATGFLPLITVFFSLNLPSALALYWAVSSSVATIQQKIALEEEVQLLGRSIALPKNKKPKKSSKSAKKSSTKTTVRIIEDTSSTKKSTTKTSKAKSNKRSRR